MIGRVIDNENGHQSPRYEILASLNYATDEHCKVFYLTPLVFEGFRCVYPPLPRCSCQTTPAVQLVKETITSTSALVTGTVFFSLAINKSTAKRRDSSVCSLTRLGLCTVLLCVILVHCAVRTSVYISSLCLCDEVLPEIVQ